MQTEYDVIVVGGGAAGLMAAGTAAFAGNRTLLLEKMEKPARKVRITGKGRCNLTNIKPEAEFLDKLQVNRDFFIPAYRAFNNRNLVNFFERRGLKLETERGGRVFPASGRAWDVAETLVNWCTECGVETVCHATVEEVLLLGNRVRGVVWRGKKGYRRRVDAPVVIITTGGASYPATGSTGDGYAFAHSTGHTIIPVRPSLVPLETSLFDKEALNGLALRNIQAELVVNGEVVASEFGEVSFTSRGIEGAAILRFSRTAVDALIDEHPVSINLDLKPALEPEVIRERINRELAQLTPDNSTDDLLRKLLPAGLARYMAHAVGSHPKRALGNLNDSQISQLINLLKKFTVPISDYRPFEESIVTAGGVSVSDINPETMESRLVSGLYFAGEVLDLDANTGGYNLQIAFSTGRLAGQLRH